MKKAVQSSGPSRKTRAALTPEARENQLIARAIDLAEKQLMEGTASSQVITHFLKLGPPKPKSRNGCWKSSVTSPRPRRIP